MLYLTRKRAENGTHRPFETGIDRLLDEMSRDLGLAPVATPEFAPSIDVTESAGAWRVRAELPGLAPEDVEIAVTGNVLTLRGEKKAETTEEGEGLRRSERRYGKFERSLEFPSDVDAAKVDAKVKHGVLTVTLPKAEAARPKTIAVKAE